jgi:hypothetical protein
VFVTPRDTGEGACCPFHAGLVDLMYTRYAWTWGCLYRRVTLHFESLEGLSGSHDMMKQ